MGYGVVAVFDFYCAAGKKFWAMFQFGAKSSGPARTFKGFA
jgi:hypothetical protein